MAARRPEAAGQRVAVDPADDRLAQVLELEEQVHEPVAVVVALELGRGRVEAGQVGAGAERPVAGAGQHDHPDLGLGAAPGQRRAEVAQHAGRERVALLGAVQRDGGDPAGQVHQHVFEVWRIGHGSTS